MRQITAPARDLVTITAGLILAADVAAVLNWATMRYFVAIAFILALLHAVILGTPAYLILRRRRPITALLCGTAGAVIGALPITILTLLPVLLPSGTDAADGPAFPTIVVTGMPHAATLRKWMKLPLWFGLHGALAGIAFFAVVRLVYVGAGWTRRMSAVVALIIGVTGAIFTIAPSLNDFSAMISSEVARRKSSHIP